MIPIKIPFPDPWPSEHVGYELFPPMYLSSPTIVFHGTVSSVLDSILREGFKAPPGESVHFAKGSTLALSVACQR